MCPATPSLYPRLPEGSINGCQVDSVEILTEDTKCLRKAKLDVTSLFLFGGEHGKRREGGIFVDHHCRCSIVVGRRV